MNSLHVKKISKISLVVCSLILGLSSGDASAQENEDFRFNGQIQVRGELDGRDFNNQTAPVTFTTIRTRLSAEKRLFEKVKLFAQIQDSRIFGEEVNTLTSLKNLDIHQGYVSLNNLFEVPMDIQLGRFEVSYNTERFFGAVAWHYNGRSFDGLRLSLKPDLFETKADIFALTHNNSFGYVGNALPDTYKDISKAEGFGIYGFWANSKINPQLNFDLFGFYEDNRKQTTPGSFDLQRFTAGVNHKGEYGSFSSVFEGAYQFGSRGALGVNAYLVSLQAFYNLSALKFGLGTDILSGNNPSSTKTNNAFDVPYGTNHKFYGYMDYFINVPGNTKNLGLNDYYFRTEWNNKEFPVSAALDIHHFSSNQASATNKSVFGQEADITLKYRVLDNTTLTWGTSAFLPGEIMSENFGGKKDLSYWSYLMLNAAF